MLLNKYKYIKYNKKPNKIIVFYCDGSKIRTYSAKALNLQFSPTLQRWRTTKFLIIRRLRLKVCPIN